MRVLDLFLIHYHCTALLSLIILTDFCHNIYRLMARREKDREERQQEIAGNSGRDRPAPLPNRPLGAARKSVRMPPNQSVEAGERRE